MPLQWRNQLRQSLEECAGKRGVECAGQRGVECAGQRGLEPGRKQGLDCAGKRGFLLLLFPLSLFSKRGLGCAGKGGLICAGKRGLECFETGPSAREDDVLKTTSRYGASCLIPPGVRGWGGGGRGGENYRYGEKLSKGDSQMNEIVTFYSLQSWRRRRDRCCSVCIT